VARSIRIGGHLAAHDIPQCVVWIVGSTDIGRIGVAGWLPQCIYMPEHREGEGIPRACPGSLALGRCGEELLLPALRSRELGI